MPIGRRMLNIDYGRMRDTRTEKERCGHVNPVHGYRCTLDRYHSGDHINRLGSLDIRWEGDSKSVEDTRAYLEAITGKENTCKNLAGENTRD